VLSCSKLDTLARTFTLKGVSSRVVFLGLVDSTLGFIVLLNSNTGNYPVTWLCYPVIRGNITVILPYYPLPYKGG
jgi:hypothetical protein